ncbi:MAG: UDP-N-acetylmuramate dehydrogenase [Melioribacteraceae bacterium]|nr:UDP-N-acetylmuramate dehydrogenase [Melioribacteraceae bacterium]MCF8354421.1 UDP-N-acetylmuramate dehydrogenase [Melioribacteraceae bacterium]MCF8392982.1 UDP-N-acetylmuramate dehydrogenase [Melioribacteraceae bacterium]MCF8417275.1 UDP-N-acetylmuramate dehydrogenase [Melioribacteraceae bacterium]
MKIFEDYSLKKLNTFHVSAKAKYFTELNSIDELKGLLDSNLFKTNKILFLGGGSNILFTKDFNGLVIRNNLKGKNVILENDSVYIESMSGEIWDELVEYCVNLNYGGIENLSLIPGTVGAAPIQNIGAYGVELADVFESLNAVNLETGEWRKFNKEDCKFGYRKSVFKNTLRDKYFIVSVKLKLNNDSRINLSYQSLKSEIEKLGKSDISISVVRELVIKIRESKLPDPAKVGNAGSFFKNPEVTVEAYQNLANKFEQVPFFRIDENKIKIPAGWLIEKCGMKGVVNDGAGTFDKQALVIVNYNADNGKKIFELSTLIQTKVKDKFNIELEAEVNII